MLEDDIALSKEKVMTITEFQQSSTEKEQRRYLGMYLYTLSYKTLIPMVTTLACFGKLNS